MLKFYKSNTSMVSGFYIQNQSKCFYKVFFSQVNNVAYRSVTLIILVTPLYSSIVFGCDLFLNGYCFPLISCGALEKYSLLVDGTVFGVNVSGRV